MPGRFVLTLSILSDFCSSARGIRLVSPVLAEEAPESELENSKKKYGRTFDSNTV